MRVLVLAPYLYIENHLYGNKNRSGLAYMIRSITDMLAKENDVWVLTQSILSKEQRINGWVLLKRNFWTILRGLRWRYIKLSIKLIRNSPYRMIPNILIYCFSAGQAEQEIKHIKPDVVHIHGIGNYTIPFYYAAARLQIPTISTLHGLISFNDIVPATTFTKKVERKFLKTFVKKNKKLTFISSGMKMKVQNWLKDECKGITVIPNCYREPPFSIKINHINRNDNTKELICIGSIYELKNQIQVIRVLPEIQKRFRGKFTIKLNLYGDGPKLEEWKEYVSSHKISGIIFHGHRSQKEIFQALSQADVLVFPSIEEGFGIPIIEAFRCGTPVVTYKDLDSSQDIYNPSSVIFARGRDDGELADAIEKALCKEWEHEKIYEWSQHFNYGRICQLYNRVLNNVKSPLDIKDVNYWLK